MWWNGNACLSSGDIALFLAVAEPLAVGRQPQLLLGTASSGDVHVAIGPDQFARFLETHSQTNLICHDAASLHWQLHGALSGSANEQARKTLWAFSQESRLVDIAMLDQLVRHFERKGAAPVQTLQELARQYLGEPLPDSETVKRSLHAISENRSQPPSPESLDMLANLAKMTLEICQKLRLRAADVSKRILASRLAPAHAFTPENHDQPDTITLPQRPTQLDTVRHSQGGTPFGPLGLGIDVKAAIALWNPARPVLRVDPEQRKDFKAECDSVFEMKSSELHNDREARKCFHWNDQTKQIEVVDGQPRIKDRQIENWLTKHAATFCDIYNLPVEIPMKPDGGPSIDPEEWGIIADCHRSLHAWKRLNRCLGILHLIDVDEARPQFEIFPALRTHGPNLDAIRELRIPLFRPQLERRFVVGSLSNLQLRAFAHICESNRYSDRSRLASYFFTQQCQRGATRCIADEVRATDPGKVLWVRLGGTVSVDCKRNPKPIANSTSQQALDDAQPLMNLERLLDAFTLGFDDALLRNLLRIRYDIDWQAGWIAELRNHLADGKILDDFKDFWKDDVLLRLSSVLNVGVMDVAKKFSEVSYEYRTLDRAIQNALRPDSPSPAVRNHIEKLLEASSVPSKITMEALREIILTRYAVTPAGRPIPPGNASEVKRQQLLLAADEALKAVAYDLVAEGYSLVAMAGDQFVLELDEQLAEKRELIDRLQELAMQAQFPILGPYLAAPCQCVVTDQWPMSADD